MSKGPTMPDVWNQIAQPEHGNTVSNCPSLARYSEKFVRVLPLCYQTRVYIFLYKYLTSNKPYLP